MRRVRAYPMMVLRSKISVRSIGAIHFYALSFDDVVPLLKKASDMECAGVMGTCFRYGYGVGREEKEAFQLVVSATGLRNEGGTRRAADYRVKDESTAVRQLAECYARGNAFASMQLFPLTKERRKIPWTARERGIVGSRVFNEKRQYPILVCRNCGNHVIKVLNVVFLESSSYILLSFIPAVQEDHAEFNESCDGVYRWGKAYIDHSACRWQRPPSLKSFVDEASTLLCFEAIDDEKKGSVLILQKGRFNFWNRSKPKVAIGSDKVGGKIETEPRFQWLSRPCDSMVGLRDALREFRELRMKWLWKWQCAKEKVKKVDTWELASAIVLLQATRNRLRVCVKYVRWSKPDMRSPDAFKVDIPICVKAGVDVAVEMQTARLEGTNSDWIKCCCLRRPTMESICFLVDNIS